RRLALSLAKEARVWIGDRGMRRIRPGLAAPVALDVAPHPLGFRLCFGLGRLHRCIFLLGVVGVARGLGWGCRVSIRGRRIVRRWRAVRWRFRPETLERGPRLDQRAIDREMLVRKQR